MFLKECTVVTSRFKAVNPFLKRGFSKLGSDVLFDEGVYRFVDIIPEVGQAQYEEFVQSRLIKGKQNVSDPLKKNSFITPSTRLKSIKKKLVPTVKETDLN